MIYAYRQPLPLADALPILPHQGREACEDLVVGAGDRHPAAVAGLEMAVRTAVERARPHAPADMPEHIEGARRLVQQPEYGFIEADVDILPLAGSLAGLQRQQRTHGAPHARGVVGDRRRAGRLRRSVRIAAEEGESAEGRADAPEAGLVLVRAGLAVARDAQHDETRINGVRSEEHTSELQSLMRISYAVFCLKKKKQTTCTKT